MNTKSLIAMIVLLLVILFGGALFLIYALGGFSMDTEKGEDEPAICDGDAMLCSDGSYVSRVAPGCDFASCPKEDLIRVDNPSAVEAIRSPLVVSGQARGFWFFEASFPVKLVDEKGNIIAQGIAQAQDEWMTEDFVPFSVTLNFNNPVSESGYLVLQKDNPSGLPEHDDELRVPVIFSDDDLPKTEVKLFYYNPEKDKDESGNIMCGREGLEAVMRDVPVTKTPIQDAVNLLLSGNLTEEEKGGGLTTEYPLEGFSLKGANLKDGVLTLEFNDPNNKTTGGSCRVGILWVQIEATAKQFPSVNEVRFIPEELFQP